MHRLFALAILLLSVQPLAACGTAASAGLQAPSRFGEYDSHAEKEAPAVAATAGATTEKEVATRSSKAVETAAAADEARAGGEPGAAPALPRPPLLVVIDPGHGGDKDGAIGPNQLKEKDAALAISLALRTQLEARGHAVVLTREADLSLGLRERIQLANEQRADLFVSVHLNSLPLGARRERVHGVETYFLSSEASDADAAALAQKENSDDEQDGGLEAGGALDAILADLARNEAHAGSSRLAYLLHSHLLQGVPSRDRGVRQAPFAVLRGAEMPAVLVEVGYISHPEEARRLGDPVEQLRIAEALADGVDAFHREVFERILPQAHAAGRER